MNAQRRHRVRGEERGQVRRSEVHRPARHAGSTRRSRPAARRRAVRGRHRLRRLVDPRLAAHQRLRHGDHPEADTARLDPFYARKTLSLVCKVSTRSRASLTAATPATSRRRPRRTSLDRRRRHVVLRARGRVLRLRLGPLRELAEGRRVRDRQRRGALEHRHEAPNLGHKSPPKEGYFPVPPNDTLADLRNDMMPRSATPASSSRSATTRSPPPGSARSASSSTR
jgi:hypothetical protein